MTKTINYNDTIKEGIPILSLDHLYSASAFRIVDIVIGIINTIDLNNTSLQLEESIVGCENHLYIGCSNTVCQAFNISMNKLQISNILEIASATRGTWWDHYLIGIWNARYPNSVVRGRKLIKVQFGIVPDTNGYIGFSTNVIPLKKNKTY